MLLSFLMALTASWIAWAPSAREIQQPAQNIPTTIRTEVALVNVIFTATDRKGKSLSGFKAEDFLVFEDRKPQRIEYFSDWTRESDIPLTVALLLDTSGSVKTRLNYEKRTAAEFFENALRRNKDLALIIQFDSDVNLVQDFTDDPKVLTAALDTIRAGNTTALYDAIFLAVQDKLKEETGRKVIVAITDGSDTSSKVSESEAIEIAQRNDVLIYGIGVRGEAQVNFGILKRFAEETGGSFFSPNSNLEEIRAAFRAIGENLRRQYSLAYRSTNEKRDGGFRSIELRCRIPGVRIQTRKGYYAANAKQDP